MQFTSFPLLFISMKIFASSPLHNCLVIKYCMSSKPTSFLWFDWSLGLCPLDQCFQDFNIHVNHRGIFLKYTFQFSQSGQALRFCILTQHTSNAEAADPGAILWVARLYTWSQQAFLVKGQIVNMSMWLCESCGLWTIVPLSYKNNYNHCVNERAWLGSNKLTKKCSICIWVWLVACHLPVAYFRQCVWNDIYIYMYVFFFNLKVFILILAWNCCTMLGLCIKWVEVILCPTKVLCKKKLKPNNKIFFLFVGLRWGKWHNFLVLLWHSCDNILKNHVLFGE